MNGRKIRLLIGRMSHESNSLPDFRTDGSWFTEYRGEAVIEQAKGTGSTLGGIVKRAQAMGFETIGSIDVVAPASALVDDGYYARIRAEFAERAKRRDFDAIALDLHGAMGTDSIPDAEGDLLAALRDAVGPGIPIGVGLDLHAHLTPKMLEKAEIVIACKENPHTDTVECGEKVVELLAQILAGRLAPVSTVARVPMILMGNGDTFAGPLQQIHSLARSLAEAHCEIHDISIYNVNRFTDDFDMGQCVVVLSNGPLHQAAEIAENIAAEFWHRREEFRDLLITVDQALDLAANPRKAIPVALADMGDRVAAGAPGDSPIILKAALARPGLRGAIPITDPAAVAKARAAGVSADIVVDVGGTMTPIFDSVTVRGKVRNLSDGVFIAAGPIEGGIRNEMGDTAVLDLENGLLLLLTSRPNYAMDPQTFESQGISIAAQDFLVVKSGYHFKVNFDGLAEPLTVATPGLGYPFPGYHPGKRARFYPEHDVSEPNIKAITFTHREPQ
ncbi:M81 family metallopeptidase [Sinorhizobium arboris]|uniref:M81 family metallopeptidase n=1 Tax=Sinorhizobium arboris TaxID=76745 RepID=UPI0004152E49|nr:M81 family metallopeptidase [Sinorhizobium arboris]